MPPAVVLVTGVSRCLGGAPRGRARGRPADRAGHRRRHRPAARTCRPRPHRVRPRRHPQPADRQGDRAARGRHRRAHEHQLARPAGAGGRASMKEINVIGTMQLLAACQKAPTGAPLVLKSTTRGLRRVLPRPGGVHRGHAAARGAARAASPRTPSRSRATSAASAAAVPTSTSPCCASPTSSARASTRRSPRYFRCRWCRRCSATTRGCSSCTRTTPSRCCARATTGDVPGTFNVGGDGMLLLSQAIRRLGRVELPVPPAGPAARWAAVASPGSPTSRPSRCGSSPTAGSSTPPGCARVRLRARGTPRRALADYAPYRSAG